MLLAIRSVIHPRNLFTWFLEAAPALIAAPILFATRKRFPLTPLVMILIAMHVSIRSSEGIAPSRKYPRPTEESCAGFEPSKCDRGNRAW